MKKLHFCAVWALASVVPMWASDAQKKVYVAQIGTTEYLVDTCYQDHLDEMKAKMKTQVELCNGLLKVFFVSCDNDEITYPGEKETKDAVKGLTSYSFDDLNGFFNSKKAQDKAKEQNFTKGCYDKMQKLWFANNFLVWTVDADSNEVVTQTPEVFFGKKPLQVAGHGDASIGLFMLVGGCVLYAVGTYMERMGKQVITKGKRASRA